MPVRSQVTDAGLALAVATLAIVGTLGAQRGGPGPGPGPAWPDAPDVRLLDAPGVVLVLAAALTLAVRRRWPVPVLGVVAAAVSTYLLLGYVYGPMLLCLAVAVYTVARHEPWRRSVAAAAGALLLVLLHVVLGRAPLPWVVALAPATAWVAVPYAVGATVRQSRLAAARERAEQVRERVADERLRLAQEVHDVVGHGLVAITVQADVARHVWDKDPERTPEALEAISRTSREALAELRATLDLVRRDPEGEQSAPGTATAAGTGTPGLGLADLPALGRRMEQAGLAVELTVAEEAAAELDAAGELAAYRVVQEALTNVLRHSPGRVARVAVTVEDGGVRITVASNGTGAIGGQPSGSGIAGMRERVSRLGGRLEAGPGGGQFQVRAWLPGTPR